MCYEEITVPFRSTIRTALLLVLTTVVTSCTAPGETSKDRRDHIQRMRQEVLSDLYQAHPAAQNEIASAPGYAVFSNRNVNIIFASGALGYGVAVDNATGASTYMRMAEGGIGLGLGVTDFRAVYVFTKRHIMDRFVDQGWQFGADADAAAKASEKGGAVGGELLLDGIKVYQMTEAGLALQVTVKGTKYWKDSELN